MFLVNPIVQEDIGWLGAMIRSQADHAFERGSPQEMRSGLPLEVNTMSRHALEKVGSCQWALLGKYILNETHTPHADVLTQTKLLTTPSITSHKYGTEKREKPVQVFSCQEMQCATRTPGTNYRTLLHPRLFNLGSNQSDAASTHSKCRS